MYLSPEPIAEGRARARDRLHLPRPPRQPDARAAGVQARARARSRSGRGARRRGRPAREARPVEGARRDARADARDAARARRDGLRSAIAEQRRELVQRIAAATADKLGDPKGAFRWWRRAHDEAPDEQTLADVRRAGEAYGLWRELAEVLTDERKRLVAVGRRRSRRARAVRRAVARARGARASAGSATSRARCTVLAEALAVAPRDAALLAELERLAAELDQRPAWKHAARCVRRRARRCDPGRARRALPAPRAHPRRADRTIRRPRSPTCSPRSRGRPIARTPATSLDRARREGARVERRRRGRQRADRARRDDRDAASSCCAARRR